jgi:outer membrane protein
VDPLTTCDDAARPLALAALAAALMVGGPALAQPLAPGDWSVRLGAGAGIGPAYPGSKTIEVTPVPLVDAAWRAGLPGIDTVFLNPRDGLGIVALRAGAFSVGGGIGYARGRDEGDAARLRGMGDIDGAPAGNLFLRAEFGEAALSLRAERAFGDQEGTTLALGASYRRQLTPSLSLTGAAGLTWADGDHMEQWFGVDAGQSRRSGLAAYKPDAGLRSATASLTASYALTPQWSLTGSIGVVHLLGDAADSPVIQRETQPFGLLGASYRF